MMNTAINTLISLIVSGIFGFLIGKINNYKKKMKDNQEESELLKEALMTMLQTNLTNTYYIYEQQRKIPDYVYRNWINSKKIFEKLNDKDELLDTLADKMKRWDFTKTDILK